MASPVDDVMQAFLYRHLAPAEEMEVAVRNSRWGARAVKIEGEIPVKLARGSVAEVRLKTAVPNWLEKPEVELDQAPEGVSAGELRVVPGGVAFDVKVEADAPEDVVAGNLIVQLFGHTKPEKPKGDKDAKAKPSRRVSLGYLPAIPYEVAKR
jgi:hypothetical protein